MDADDALWCYQIFRVIVGYMSPFDDGNLSYIMRLALVSKRVRTLVVRFLADPRASARVFSDPLKFNSTMTDRPLGLLLPPGPLSMLGSRGSHRVTRSGCIGNVAAPSDWSLVRVGSITLLPSSDEDINKRLALLARIVPDLHTVHAMMPESRKRGPPANISRQCEASEHRYGPPDLPNGALVSLIGFCSLKVHSTVATARALVQVAGLSLERCAFSATSVTRAPCIPIPRVRSPSRLGF
jgi:hypothetical protein